MNDPVISDPNSEQPKKKRSTLRYVIYILIVLVATALSLAFSLWGEKFNQVMNAFSLAFQTERGWMWMLIVAGLVVASYLVDGLIILVFCRLYTRNYRYHQGLATSMIGQFYSDVTPGASGGQVMQVYTMKSQGVNVAAAASIAVMWFIMYQTVLILFDVVAFIIEFPLLAQMKVESLSIFEWTLTDIPLWPFIAVGFALNAFTIVLMLMMSYSHKFHNFILHYVIGFLGKIRILKNPDKSRANLRVQVENFKIELRRLQSNVPVVALLALLFTVMLILRYCIPYFAGLAMASPDLIDPNLGYDFNGFAFFDAAFLSAFHQMTTGLVPIPGSAGISELFYSLLFHDFFIKYFTSPYENIPVLISSSLILWRTMTFHLPMLVSGFVSAFYRSRPKETIHYANRETMLTIQMETYAGRKASADTMYETAQLSRKDLQRRLAETMHLGPKKTATTDEEEDNSFLLAEEKKSRAKKAKPKKEKSVPKEKKPRAKKKSKDEGWDSLNI